MDEEGKTLPCYANTNVPIRLGDQVRFVDDPDLLVVEVIIDSTEEARNWGVEEFGVMLRGGKYGLVFTSFDDPELEFVSRKREQ